MCFSEDQSNDDATPDVDDLNAEHVLHLHSNEINEINSLDDQKHSRFQM